MTKYLIDNQSIDSCAILLNVVNLATTKAKKFHHIPWILVKMAIISILQYNRIIKIQAIPILLYNIATISWKHTILAYISGKYLVDMV